jgi:hypothetical protein
MHTSERRLGGSSYRRRTQRASRACQRRFRRRPSDAQRCAPSAPPSLWGSIPNPAPSLHPCRRRAAVAARNASFKGLSVTVLAPRNDEYVGASILATGGPFAPETLGSMLEFVRPGATVVDAGCNFGSYSVFFAAKVGPTGRVHCFEPQKKMAQVGRWGRRRGASHGTWQNQSWRWGALGLTPNRLLRWPAEPQREEEKHEIF